MVVPLNLYDSWPLARERTLALQLYIHLNVCATSSTCHRREELGIDDTVKKGIDHGTPINGRRKRLHAILHKSRVASIIARE